MRLKNNIYKLHTKVYCKFEAALCIYTSVVPRIYFAKFSRNLNSYKITGQNIIPIPNSFTIYTTAQATQKLFFSP